MNLSQIQELASKSSGAKDLWNTFSKENGIKRDLVDLSHKIGSKNSSLVYKEGGKKYTVMFQNGKAHSAEIQEKIKRSECFCDEDVVEFGNNITGETSKRTVFTNKSGQVQSTRSERTIGDNKHVETNEKDGTAYIEDHTPTQSNYKKFINGDFQGETVDTQNGRVRERFDQYGNKIYKRVNKFASNEIANGKTRTLEQTRNADGSLYSVITDTKGNIEKEFNTKKS